VLDADATVAALTEQPPRTVLISDYDGSLSPIVERPEDAGPLPGVVDVLEALGSRLGRVAILSGRPVDFLASQLPVPGLTFVGLYGMERLHDGRRTVDPRVEPFREAVATASRAGVERFGDELVERKADVSFTFHWRRAPELRDEMLAAAHDLAARHGLAELHTRMAVEVRPPIAIDKGAAVADLVNGFHAGAFAGDDTGDLPAFAQLERAVADGHLSRGVRIGVRSAEAPPELLGAVDVVVDGPTGLLALLRRVADEIREPI
jgi:trehalose 6-phosphate phosphatase